MHMKLMANPDHDYMFKLLLVGNSGTGKSSLLLKYTDNSFTNVYLSTIGVDFKIKTINVDGATVKLQMWDTAGQERFRTITSSYYRGADAVLVVYDVNDKRSYDGINDWLKETDTYASPDIIKILIGNKSDLEGHREVEYSESKKFAESLGMALVETSAKKGTNIDFLFMMIARSIKDKVASRLKDVPLNIAPLCLDDDNTLQKKYKCCQ
jgi:Ras-related protein Rab-1A